MKKRCVLIMSIVVCTLFVGCAGSTDNTNALKDKLESARETAIEEQADEPAEKKIEDLDRKKEQEKQEAPDDREEDTEKESEKEPEEQAEQEPYSGVLYWYKELQDSGKTWEEMEEYTSQTELVQHGWPYGTDNNEIRYVYYDLTGDGYDELIITYYNDPVDIYSNEGDAVYSYGVPYRALVSLYPDGTLMEGLTLGTKGWSKTWYRYDDDSCKYVSVKEELSPQMSEIRLPEGKKIADVVVPEWFSLSE